MQVNFLRKGEYLAPASEIRVYGGGMDAAVMKQMREAHKRDKQKKDRVAQIAAVERTFSQASTASVFCFIGTDLECSVQRVEVDTDRRSDY
jgi:hypothetical protein